jgi:hypothetical protein
MSPFKRTVILIGILMIITAGLILAFYLGLKKPDTTLIPESGIASQVTSQINKYINTKIASPDNKVTVFVPADAIKSDGYIVFTSMAPNLFTEPNGEWKRPIVVSLELYDAQGKIIQQPLIKYFIDICFILGDEEKAGYSSHPEDYYIQYYEEKQNENEWLKIAYSSKSDNKQLCGEIDHLTLFSLAIKGEKYVPTPSQGPYTP